MENSEKVFFDDDRAQWYLAAGGSHLGPLTASDVYEKILAREITWAHYVWRPGENHWVRICDVPTFQIALPQKPAQALPAVAGKTGASPGGAKTKAVDDPTGMRPPGPEDKVWFLYYNHSQYGPFSKDEVNRLILVGRIHGRVHTWKNGLPNWERLERIPDFKEVLANSADLPEIQTLGHSKARAHRLPTGQTGSIAKGDTKTGTLSRAKEEESVRLARDKRTAMRAPLVAKIVMADDKGVSVGVCRDISIGGMQVLTDRIPGDTGSRIRLNVSALGNEASEPAPGDDEESGQDDHGRLKIESFVAEGVIVRILEDNRGFSFRFDKLSATARRSIERYIDSTA